MECAEKLFFLHGRLPRNQGSRSHSIGMAHTPVRRNSKLLLSNKEPSAEWGAKINNRGNKKVLRQPRDEKNSKGEEFIPQCGSKS